MSAHETSALGASASLLSYGEAAAVVADFARALHPGAVETIDLADARGRVLAGAIAADVDQPSFPRSTREGFACRAIEASTHEFLPVAGATHAGEAPPPPLPPQAMWEIMTGAPMPAGADAVVMIEHVERDGERARLLPPRTAKPGENIVAQGEQARAGDALIAAGTVMGPAQIALAAACGYASVSVHAQPRVAILTTGDELVPVDREPGPGQIRNSNAPMLEALVRAAGGDPWISLTAGDTAESLDFALSVAADSDMLLISGGVSAGKFDLVEPALARLGATFHFTGVRIQPGKPLVFGALRASTSGVDPAGEKVLPFFGLPGNPISSAATFLLFAAPVIAALAGRRDLGPRFLAAELAQGTDRRGNAGLTRFLPSWCEFDVPAGWLPQVATVPWHGSGDLPAFARSNCFLVVPEGAATLEAGTQVRILML
jgi:molybdopterin molybdotransferase